MTKQRAIEILNVIDQGEAALAQPLVTRGAQLMLEALDAAGAFVSEETAAEIERYARIILSFPEYREGVSAHRLASACRSAGLVKP